MFSFARLTLSLKHVDTNDAFDFSFKNDKLSSYLKNLHAPFGINTDGKEKKDEREQTILEHER